MCSFDEWKQKKKYCIHVFILFWFYTPWLPWLLVMSTELEMSTSCHEWLLLSFDCFCSHGILFPRWPWPFSKKDLCTLSTLNAVPNNMYSPNMSGCHIDCLWPTTERTTVGFITKLGPPTTETCLQSLDQLLFGRPVFSVSEALSALTKPQKARSSTRH